MKPETRNRLLGLREANDDHAALMSALRPKFERMRNRHENGTAPRAVSAFQLFQTPQSVAVRLVESLGLEPGARVGEFSAGLGRILDALIPFQPSEVVAVEIDANLARELYRQERPGVTLKQRDFLTCTPEELGLFDAVAINPPFHMRADIRHIRHALTFLKPGGKLAAICFNTKHRETELRPLASSWEVLPAGTFGKAGTNIETVLLTIPHQSPHQ